MGRPNEYGFAGDPTTPEPADNRDPVEETAVPDSDLTESLAEGAADATGQDDEDDDLQ